jgi:formimidoylglutamate deiminase
VLRDRLLMPGLVNAHSHAFQRAFRGHVQWKPPGKSDFWSWRDAMYRTANRLTPEGVQAVSALCFVEMAEAGVTEVGEFHYLHHQPDGTPYDDPDELANRVIAGALSVGIRIRLLRVVYARNGVGVPLRDDQRRFRDQSADAPLRAIERLSKHADVRVSVGLAPHSVRAVPSEWMPELASFPGPVHAHISEQPAENEACLAATGLSPLAVFEAGGLVSDRFTAVHLTFPLEGDLQRMRQAGATLCACPITELDLGDGLLPLEARADRVCVGSDSHARIDLLEEARSIELHGRAQAGRRNLLAPEGERHGLAARLLHIATSAGRRALGASGQGLVAGALADFISINLDRPGALGVPPLEAAAFVATPEWIDQTWVAGVPLLHEGRHPARRTIAAAARDLIG